MIVISDHAFKFYDLKPPAVDMRAEVLEGLTSRPKYLAPKFLYDQAGSALFEAITELPEYYLTRTEIGILEAHRDEMAARIGAGSCLIEFGSGNSRKIRLLLERLRPHSYVPVDISRKHLEASARLIFDEFSWLNVYPVSADYTSELSLPSETGSDPRVAFFPGSSIGNFEPPAAVDFLSRTARLVGPGGKLLLGVDRKKDRAILEAAYDDAAGVTADFNLNMLRHLNVALEADFDVSRFTHVALYNETLGCIQMFLESRVDQSVLIDRTSIDLRAGERIHTENSFKYDPQEFSALAQQAGFRCDTWWTDDQDLFAVFLLVNPGPA